MRDDELDEELRAGLELEIDERTGSGMSRAEAEASARRAFGNLTLINEMMREVSLQRSWKISGETSA